MAKKIFLAGQKIFFLAKKKMFFLAKRKIFLAKKKIFLAKKKIFFSARPPHKTGGGEGARHKHNPEKLRNGGGTTPGQ